MTAKYDSPFQITAATPYNGSRLWGLVHQHLMTIILEAKLVVGQGNSSFWYSLWTTGTLPPPLPCTSTMTIARVKRNNFLRRRMLPHLPPNCDGQIHKLELNDQPYFLVWKPNPTGRFTTASYGHFIRLVAHPFTWYKQL